MINVILSIKPQYANKIFDGSKKFEFRKTMFKNQNVKKVIVYASAPIKKVIGEFEIDEVLNCDLETLWSLTHDFSGISEEYFYKYFSNKQKGYAIKIKQARRYRVPKCLKEDFNLLPPQSFVYSNT